MPKRAPIRRRSESAISLFRALSYAVNEHPNLFSRNGVIGYGIGYRERGGRITSEPAIRVYVRKGLKRRSMIRIPTERRIPEALVLTVDGQTINLPIDLVEAETVKILRSQPNAGPYICSGATIGNLMSVKTSGTIGWIGRMQDGTPVVCSCYHVLLPFRRHSQSTNGRLSYNALPENEEVVVSPSRFRQSAPPFNIVGRVLKGLRNHIVDAAYCCVDNEQRLLAYVELLGALNSPIPVSYRTEDAGPGDHVQMCGGESRRQAGAIIDINVSLPVAYAGGRVQMTDLVTTSIVTQPGDSGSLLLSKHMEPIGMLIGSSGTRSVFCRIDKIMRELELKPY